jgi:NTE family protein
MVGTPNRGPTKKTEIGLVLQGGGALGAYEYGGILALLDLMDQAAASGRDFTLRVVTGVSIGAINAACIVGASDRRDARARLGALWNDFMITAPAFVPAAVTSNIALFEVPHFYRFSPGWNFTYLYETRELLATLTKHVDFRTLNKSPTAFVVTAADVTSGQLAWFANQKVGEIEPTTIEPKHVLASGSLAPQFPATQIGEGENAPHYWDGGLIDNTPLGAAIDALDSDPNVGKLLVVMNLFPLTSNLPRTYTEVSERVDQLRFGNRLRQDMSNARQFNTLITAIRALAAQLPQQQPDLPELQKILTDYKLVEPIEIALGPKDALHDPYGFHDFSRQGIEARRDRGRAITLETLTQFFADKIAA